ncbi:PREDICTED: uncharacterized protein LOC108770299 [Trachymyrmex cornetzi]|uniref:uncharacterized protein LOC108770299 n=1 Tax=Trachymyrmex cornetzi TaxID=471704 RepID=UPI00084EE7F7|nr:PREDICTED: uncharacterized protein LOC108770299 [Trachymyrmex cornetzi]
MLSISIFKKFCLFCGGTCLPKDQIKFVQKPETRDKIIEALEEREKSSISDKNLLARLRNNPDLPKIQARYHPDCMSQFYMKKLSNQVRRPPSQNTTEFIEFALNYIDQNQSDSQFSLNEIKEEFKGETIPELKTIKSRFNKAYPDEIQFVHLKSDLIILFRNKISKQAWQEWYKNQQQDVELERKRIVKMAAKIILEDIRSTVYDNCLPESLTNFLDVVMKNHKAVSRKNDFKWKKRIATIAHSIIMSARPRTFLSPILLGLSSMMHKKYASRDLIDSLSYLGLCATYDETLRFEASILDDPENHVCKSECFVQYVFDNADHNTCTLDGKNTMHVMGGIKVATPSSDVISKKKLLD